MGKVLFERGNALVFNAFFRIKIALETPELLYEEKYVFYFYSLLSIIVIL